MPIRAREKLRSLMRHLRIHCCWPVLKKAWNQSPTVRLNAPEGRLQVIFLDSNCGDGKKICIVAAIRKKRVPVLKESYRPDVFFPFQQVVPSGLIYAAVDPDVAVTINRAGFHHRRKENRFPCPTSVDRRTVEFGNLRYDSPAAVTIDVICFEWCVGGKI